jgi:S-adenosylmethionine:tRNA ribosyltransferase-isomerase
MYDFDLPERLIAQVPAQPRDHARLLVYSLADGSIQDKVFYELDSFLKPNTTLAINNSKVENCRLLFDDGKTEVFVLEKNDPYVVRAMVRPGRKFRIGSRVQLTDWLNAEVIAVDNEGIRTIKLNVQHDDPRLKDYEHIPLPPYIAQNDNLADEYQTVYSKPPGSLAASTAGLHFTRSLLADLQKTHELAEITLHVGLGTFAKLTEENLTSGRLHKETYNLSQEAASVLNQAKHITAIGTTTTRTLESMSRPFEARSGATDIFIRPGYKFWTVDSLITNFHLPGTSLLMLVAAFIADKRKLSEVEAATELHRIYAHAIDRKYRFYSFGDAMLIV